MIYKLCPLAKGNTEVKSINRINDDGSLTSIPVDESNRDYQEYLEWVAEGGQVEEAD